MSDISDRLLTELVDAVKDILRKEQSDRLRDVYLIGDIDKDSARSVIERLRELANDSKRPLTLYINSAGGNVTDGLAIHDAVRHLVARGVEVTITVQGMAYSLGSGGLQAPRPGGRGRPAAGGPRAAPGVRPLVDHDSRAGEVGGVAVDDGSRATPRPFKA